MHVAKRQISSALIALEKKEIQCTNYTASIETSASPGSSILVYSASDFGPFVGGDSIGEPGKRAEFVGKEVGREILGEYALACSGGPLSRRHARSPTCPQQGQIKIPNREVNPTFANKLTCCKRDRWLQIQCSEAR